ncbi:hypothetical protein PPACK8108_LOCUS1126 [Phakopsora pachyrhizi]|uniref:Uncharacterized protein n=1 Tax=Phakopsora pachyrhizi TaxID=170000 RepID=A0AAV0AJ53_PHAPC|nr:hypothetical protein PPACK8108_LOCUS1126 [Phakopsora pachyrhizi]
MSRRGLDLKEKNRLTEAAEHWKRFDWRRASTERLTKRVLEALKSIRPVESILERARKATGELSENTEGGSAQQGKVKEELQALQERRQTLGSTHNKTVQYLEEDYEICLAKRIEVKSDDTSIEPDTSNKNQTKVRIEQERTYSMGATIGLSTRRRVARLFSNGGLKGSSYQAALLLEAFKSFQTKQPWDFERIHNSDHGLCKREAEMTRLQKQFFEDDSPHWASLKKKRMTMTMAEVKNLGTWSNSVNSNNRSKTTTALARIAALFEGFGGDLKRLIGLGQTVIVIWKGPWRDLIKPEQVKRKREKVLRARRTQTKESSPKPKSLSVGQNLEELQRMVALRLHNNIARLFGGLEISKETAGGEDDHEPELRELQDRPQKE